MATVITMPRYGANMEEGTVASWMIEEGDTVEPGEIIGEIAIEKLSNDLESPVAGTVLKIIAEEEETLLCGEPIAIIGEEDEDISSLIGAKNTEDAVEEVKAPEAVVPNGNYTVVEMPRYGANMDEGTVSDWFVEVGDEVEEGDAIGEIAIEKLSNELLAPISGTVLKLIADAEDTLDCGAPIAIIGEAGSDVSGFDGKGAVPAVAKETAPVVESAPMAAVETREPVGDVMITPKGLDLAENENIEYRAIVGTGRHGAITREDVRNYIASGTAKSATSVSPTLNDDVKATPKAMKLAEELSVDVRSIKGTGRHGMVTREDIRSAVIEGTAVKLGAGADAVVSSTMSFGKPEAKRVKRTEMQKVISKAMMGSLQETAQTTISMDMDVSNMVEAYQANKVAYKANGVKLSYTAILIKAVAMALIEHEDLRTSIEGNDFVTTDQINIGVAIDVPGGLVVPNIKKANEKDVSTIAVELADLATRSKENALTMDEMTGGTFSITNLGMFGIKYFTPVLNPPESGILGVGALVQQPVVKNGGIFMNHIMNFSLTHDHRIVNGAPAARFLNGIKDILEKAEELL
jgi:pyruvate dehydrogenase E2 component (dihydrolipoamide acetyltransferase)